MRVHNSLSPSFLLPSSPAFLSSSTVFILTAIFTTTIGITFINTTIATGIFPATHHRSNHHPTILKYYFFVTATTTIATFIAITIATTSVNSIAKNFCYHRHDRHHPPPSLPPPD
jgi:hypothetical protein